MAHRESTKFPKHYASRFQVTDSARQDIPSPAFALKEFDIAAFDMLGEFDLATETFTPLYSGDYLLTAQLRFFELLNVGNVAHMEMRVNAAPLVQDRYIANGANWQYLSCTKLVRLTLGDLVTLHIAQNSAINRELSQNFPDIFFEGFRVG